jgi:hypothetical protein
LTPSLQPKALAGPHKIRVTPLSERQRPAINGYTPRFGHRHCLNTTPGPKGRLLKAFEAVSSLPKRQQEVLLQFIESAVGQRKAS